MMLKSKLNPALMLVILWHNNLITIREIKPKLNPNQPNVLILALVYKDLLQIPVLHKINKKILFIPLLCPHNNP